MGIQTDLMKRASVILTMATLASLADGAPRADRWRWSNPAPHGNNVMDMLISTDLGVQVGDAGSIHVQRSDERWAPVYSGIREYLRGVTMLGGRVIAVGENGTAIWSDDAAEFHAATLSPPNTLDWFEGVAASGQRAVAVGDFGAIYSSLDGATWTAATSGTSEWLRSVAFGGGVFVAVGENGSLLRSEDGLAWIPVNSGTAAHLNRVRYLGNGGSGRFVAVGNQGVSIESPLGAAPWTSLNSGVTNDFFDVAANTRGVLLVGDDALLFKAASGSEWVDQIMMATNAAPPGIYLSATGKGDSWTVAGRSGLMVEGARDSETEFAWTTTPFNSSRAWLWDLTEQNGIRVAVGDLANIQTSLDGILWTQEAVPVSRTNTVLLGVGGTTNRLLAVGNDGNVLTSDAGRIDLTVTNEFGITNIWVEGFAVVWSNAPSFTTYDLQGVDGRDGLFVLSGENGAVFTSPDGAGWTERVTPATQFLSSVAIGSNAVVAVGAGGTILRSLDEGATWSAVSSGVDDWLYRVRWIEDLFFVTGEGGTILTSPDGANWTPRSSGTTAWLTDVAYVEDQWFVSGYQGTVLTSSNAVAWSAVPVPTGKSLFAASGHAGQLLLAGVDGVMVRNQIAAKTAPVELLDYHYSQSADTNGVATIYELFLFGGEPDQFFALTSCTNLCGGSWTNINGVLEIFDASGALYAFRTRDATNAPLHEYYQTTLLP